MYTVNSSCAALCGRGIHSQEILAAKRGELLRRIEKLNACVDYIDWKQGFYDDVLSGKTKCHSNLIKAEE
ncbi:MAG: hypothetical protein IJ313_00315 [Clostridia bacterium]|nr:hypothetical protein [Clostridia bacterium]